MIDAGALTGLSAAAALAPLAGRLVLTPHEGEMAALLGVPGGEVEADPAAAARRAAAQWSATVALKGRDTYVASPDGLVWRHEGPVPGLGVSGSGDVLAGVIGGLLAQGAPPATATLWGVWLHAMAGRTLAEDVGPSGYLARELAARIPGLRRQAAP